MYQIKVDVIGFECLKLTLKEIFHLLLILADPDAHLVCQIVAAAIVDFKCFAENLFRFSFMVNHSGIKIVDAHVVCFSQKFYSFLSIYFITVLWETHSAITQTGNLAS